MCHCQSGPYVRYPERRTRPTKEPIGALHVETLATLSNLNPSSGIPHLLLMSRRS